MKKFYIFLLNTLLFLGIIICFDYYKAQNAYNNYFEKLKKQYPTVKENPCNRDFYYSLRMLSFDKIYFFMKKSFDMQGRVLGESYTNKSPILVFGCSFAEGSLTENFEYQLAEKTKRKVYNFGHSGLGVATMYNQLKQPDFKELLDKNKKPEYIIYIFITDHIYRLYSDKYGAKEKIYVKENIQPENIKTQIFRQLCRLWIGSDLIGKYIYKNYLAKEKLNNSFDLLIEYFKGSKKEAQKYNKDIKFIILKYPTEHISPEELNELYTTARWNELSLDGFIVIDLKEYIDEDLTDKKYMFQDFHPNKEAWNVITNKLAKDINNSKI